MRLRAMATVSAGSCRLPGVPMIVHGFSNLWTMSQVTILAALLR